MLSPIRRKLLQIANLTTHSFIVKFTIWRNFLLIGESNLTTQPGEVQKKTTNYAYKRLPQDEYNPWHWSSNHLPLRILGHQAPSRLCHLAGRAAESAARRQRASGYLWITTKKTVLRLFVSPLADERFLLDTGRTCHLQTTTDSSVVEILPTAPTRYPASSSSLDDVKCLIT